MKYSKAKKYSYCIRCAKKFEDNSGLLNTKRDKERRGDEVRNFAVCPECMERSSGLKSM